MLFTSWGAQSLNQGFSKYSEVRWCKCPSYLSQNKKIHTNKTGEVEWKQRNNNEPGSVAERSPGSYFSNWFPALMTSRCHPRISRYRWLLQANSRAMIKSSWEQAAIYVPPMSLTTARSAPHPPSFPGHTPAWEPAQASTDSRVQKTSSSPKSHAHSLDTRAKKLETAHSHVLDGEFPTDV